MGKRWDIARDIVACIAPGEDEDVAAQEQLWGPLVFCLRPLRQGHSFQGAEFHLVLLDRP